MTSLLRDINPSQKDIGDWLQLGNGIVCHRYGILTTSYVCYAAYEVTNDWKSYSTFTSNRALFPDSWLGEVDSRALPPELDWLPAYSKERISAVIAYQSYLKSFAESCCKLAFPDDFKNERMQRGN